MNAGVTAHCVTDETAPDGRTIGLPYMRTEKYAAGIAAQAPERPILPHRSAPENPVTTRLMLFSAGPGLAFLNPPLQFCLSPAFLALLPDPLPQRFFRCSASPVPWFHCF